MKTYVALFRGLNVGGNNVVPMKELVTLLENIGLCDVRTYIQSGNAVFESEEEDTSLLSNRIRAEIGKTYGFEPHVLLLTSEEMERAVGSNPFPEAESEPKTLHLNLLASKPEHPDLDALEAIKSNSERFVLKDRVFFLHTPDGLGRSRLAANAEKLLGVPMTGRNWRTVSKIMALVKKRAS